MLCINYYYQTNIISPIKQSVGTDEGRSSTATILLLLYFFQVAIMSNRITRKTRTIRIHADINNNNYCIYVKHKTDVIPLMIIIVLNVLYNKPFKISNAMEHAVHYNL